MANEILAKFRLEAGRYRQISGSAEYADRAQLLLRTTDMDRPHRELTEKERQSIAAPNKPAEAYSGRELEELAKTDPARFRAIMNDRRFRREVGAVGLTDDALIARLERHRRPDLVAEFNALQKALT